MRSRLSSAVALLAPGGRASRRVYWTYLAAEAIVWVAIGAAIDGFDIDLFDQGYRALAVAAASAITASLIGGALVGVKRLHDTDRSGWFLILCVLPVVGWLIAAAMLNAPGTPGPNRFGPRA